MKTIAIIAAGGKGRRFDESLPKQYHQINGKEIIVYTLEIFQKCSLIDEIVVAAQKDFHSLIYELSKKYGITKLKQVADGGIERQDSVLNALLSIEAESNDLIAVHDAARPLLPEKVLFGAIKEANLCDNILVCLKARDTLLKGDNFAEAYINRENVFYAQTPQIFRYDVLKSAMDMAKKDNFYATDESMLVVRAGYKVKLFEGSPLNIKITSAEDLEIMRKIII